MVQETDGPERIQELENRIRTLEALVVAFLSISGRFEPNIRHREYYSPGERDFSSFEFLRSLSPDFFKLLRAQESDSKRELPVFEPNADQNVVGKALDLIRGQEEQRFDRVRAIEINIAEFLETISQYDVFAAMPMSRTISFGYYLQKAQSHTTSAMYKFFVELHLALGIQDIATIDPIIGSLFEKFWGQTKDLVTKEELLERVRKLERALELKGIDNPQADVDLKTAKAARELMRAFEHESEAIAFVGSLCVLKHKNKAAIFALSQEHQAEIKKHPEVLQNPAMLHQLVFGDAEQQGAKAVVVKDGSPKSDSSPKKRSSGKPPKEDGPVSQ